MADKGKDQMERRELPEIGAIVAAVGEERDFDLGFRGIKKGIPYVGAQPEDGSKGIGIYFPDTNSGQIWGIMGPIRLIQSWRAMKILQDLQLYHYDETLAECWELAGKYKPTENIPTARYLEGLSRRVGGIERLNELREKVFKQIPSAEELDSMIKKLHDKGVEVAGWELKDELEAGRIPNTSLVTSLIETSTKRKETASVKTKLQDSPNKRVEAKSKK